MWDKKSIRKLIKSHDEVDVLFIRSDTQQIYPRFKK